MHVAKGACIYGRVTGTPRIWSTPRIRKRLSRSPSVPQIGTERVVVVVPVSVRITRYQGEGQVVVEDRGRNGMYRTVHRHL